jgi:hypothetical protein
MKESFTNSTQVSSTSAEAFDRHLINEAHLLFKKINHLTINYRAVDVHDEVYRQVRRLENYLGQVKDAKTRYYIYKAADLYCVIYKKPADRVPYLHMMMDILEKDNTDIPDREKALTMFKFGDVLYDENKIEQTHSFVYKLYCEQPRLFKNLMSGYHLLVETGILLKKYDLAESILKNEFQKIIEEREQNYCTFALMNYAKLYLYKGDYDKALSYIVETKKAHNAIFNAGQEAEIRLYENMCFFFSGDIEFAKQLVITNLIFCYSKGMQGRDPHIKQMFDIIEASINSRLTNKPISIETMDALMQLQKGTYAISGKLLMRMASGNNDIG